MIEDDFLARQDNMEREHAAWLDLMNELRRHGERTLQVGRVSGQTLDLNAAECKPLVNAIKKWGEELVALRATLPEHVVARALDEARGDYPGQYERGTYPE